MRGKAEFVPMKTIQVDNKDITPCAVGGQQDPEINARAPKRPGDPMRDILSDKGLVDTDINRKGFGRNLIDEAVASIKK